MRGRLRFTAGSRLSYVDARDVADGRLLAQEPARSGRRHLLTNDEGASPIPFDPEAAKPMFSLVNSGDERASMIITANKPLLSLGPDLRRPRHRCRP